MEDYETTYEEFWKEIVENPDGSLDVDEVKRELHDFDTMLREVPKVYCHVTGGLLSNPLTNADAIIEEADSVISKLIDEGVEDEIKPYKIEIEELENALYYTQKHLDSAKEDIRDLTISMRELLLSQRAEN